MHDLTHQLGSPGAGSRSLRHRVVFVCRNPERWPDLFDGSSWPATLDGQHERVVTHEDLAIVQSAVVLAGLGYEVELCAEFQPDAINVVSSVDLRISDRTAHAFVVAFRADWARPILGDLTLTMNETIATRPTEFALPRWTQTGLVRRDPDRPSRVENLVFKGDLVNLDARFRSDSFGRELARRDIRFRCDVFDHATQTSGWNDYRDVDAVLAVRDIPPTETATKPASKLINSWAAGVVAILGNEPAYRELRRHDLDYFEVSTPQQALDALDRLNRNPRFYDAVVGQGRIRAADYTNERTAERWMALLNGVVADAFERWLAENPLHRTARHAVRAVGQRVENAVFRRRQATR